MKHLQYLLLLVCSLVFFACDDSDDDQGSSGKYKKVWCPNLHATAISDGSISIQWESYENSVPYVTYVAYIKADKYEIYQSDSPDKGFMKIAEAQDNGESIMYSVNNLTNGKPLYFYLKGIHKGYDDEVSNTIMLIPNPQPKTEAILYDEKGQYEKVWFSPDKTKVAYTSYRSQYECYFAIEHLTDDSEERVEIYPGTDPSWSSDGSKIVFSTGVYDDAKIILRDLDTKESIVLSENYASCYQPKLSADSKYIIYKATDIETHDWNIRRIDIEAEKDSILLNNTSEKKILNLGNIEWIDNDSYLVDGDILLNDAIWTKSNSEADNIGIYPFISQILKVSIKDNTVERVLEGQWPDSFPSLSPDKKNMAFISMRSGKPQVWLQNTETGKLIQLTGYTLSEEYKHQGMASLGWLDNNTIYYSIDRETVYKITI